jgi:hypothetical protein
MMSKCHLILLINSNTSCDGLAVGFMQQLLLYFMPPLLEEGSCDVVYLTLH